MATYQILYWYDIPTQVRAKEGRQRVSKPLPDRFMETVDKTAMAARITGGDAYMNGFKWTKAQEREGTPEEVATVVVEETVAQYETINWRETANRLKAGS
jgi:hypothetical protein